MSAHVPTVRMERHGSFEIVRHGEDWIVTGPAGFIQSAPNLLSARKLVEAQNGRLWVSPPRGALK